MMTTIETFATHRVPADGGLLHPLELTVATSPTACFRQAVQRAGGGFQADDAVAAGAPLGDLTVADLLPLRLAN